MNGDREFLFGERIEGELSRRALLARLGLAGAALSAPGAFASEALASGTGRRAAGTRGADIEVVNWGMAGGLSTVYTPKSADIPTIYATASSIESLLSIDDKGRLRPGLASSWHQPDPLTYVYKLRAGVKFWNGDPLTADDVVFSLLQGVDPKVGSQFNSYFGSVKSVKKTGADEVTIKLKAPEATFQWIPGSYFAPILQKKFVQAHGKNLGTPGTLIMATGPYAITKLVPDESLTLERNETYWGPKPPVKKVILKPIAEDATRLVAMQSGDIDGAGSFSVPVENADKWARIPNVDVSFTSSLQLGTFAFNCAKAPWDDVHVRRAVAHSIDKKGLIQSLFKGHAKVANAMPPPGDWIGWLSQDEIQSRYAKLPTYDFDLDKAKAELKKSRHADGFSGTIVYADRDAALGKAALTLKENLAKIGGKINVKQVTGDAWFALIVGPKGKLDVTAGQLGTDYNDPGENVYVNFHSKFAINGAYNFANYKNPAMDKLLDREVSLKGHSSKRADALFAVLNTLATELPQLYLWWNDTAMAIKDTYKFEGFNSWSWVQPWATRIREA